MWVNFRQNVRVGPELVSALLSVRLERLRYVSLRIGPGQMILSFLERCPLYGAFTVYKKIRRRRTSGIFD